MTRGEQQAQLRFLLGVHLCFVLVGATTTIVGVVLPALAAKLELNDRESAAFFVAHAAGSIIGTLVSARLSIEIGFLKTIAAGLLASAIGVAAIGAPFSAVVAAAIFVNGLGVGLSIPTVNLLIARVQVEQTAAALNLLNFSWSVGALVSPLFFAALGNRLQINAPLFALAAALIVFAGLFAARDESNFVEKNDSETPETNAPKSALAFWANPQTILTLSFFFVYLGAENGLGGWLASFGLRREVDKTTLWTPVLTVFWAAFLLGRLAAPVFLRRLRDETFLRVNAALALFGMIVLLVFERAAILNAGAALAAFGLAPIFPTALAQFAKRAGDVGTSQAKWLFVSATLGGTFVTWLVGAVAQRFGDLRAGLSAVLVCCLLMLALRFAVKPITN